MGLLGVMDLWLVVYTFQDLRAQAIGYRFTAYCWGFAVLHSTDPELSHRQYRSPKDCQHYS